MIKNERKKEDISNASEIAMKVSVISIVGNCLLSLLKFLAACFIGISGEYGLRSLEMRQYSYSVFMSFLDKNLLHIFGTISVRYCRDYDRYFSLRSSSASLYFSARSLSFCET